VFHLRTRPSLRCHSPAVIRFLPELEHLEERTVPAAVLPAGFVETPFATGLNQPTAMEFAPDGRLFVAEKGGSLRVILPNGTLLPTPFLTVPVNTASERGLIGITFDPNFATNRFIYVYYTTNAATPVNRISRFTADAVNPNVAQAGSEQIILDNIPSTNGNHNGGALHFGTDGMLYVGVGESGVGSNSQTLTNVAGKILRLNVAAFPNIIPPDNPFVGTPGARGEIWALGFRNPFTFNVQSTTGTIFVNDVGQNTFEEIDNLVKGGNYGWPNAEGPSTSGFINPIFFYPHNGNNAAITGGVFYQSSALSITFQGSYFFSDYLLGFIQRLTPAGQAVGFATNADSPVDLDVGPDGALYYLSINSGKVFRISATPTIPPGSPTGVIAVGAEAGTPGFVQVFDARSGRLRARFLPYGGAFRGGVRVAVGDVNHDGVPDIITGPGPGAGPNVKVIDGASGALNRSFFGLPPRFLGGVYVAAGDVNGDGFADIIVGAGTGSIITVFDGATGGLIRIFSALPPGFRGGVSVAAGDLNGDGRADIIAGAGPGSPGAVIAFNGVTGAPITAFFPYGPAFRGGVFVAAGDVDGDGVADIITGPGVGAVSLVRVFNAGGTHPLSSFLALPPASHGGARVAAVDVTGDGKDEVVVGFGRGLGSAVGVFDPLTLALDRVFLGLSEIRSTGVFVG
jgi:glucose/arabinose dehydrogenase